MNADHRAQLAESAPAVVSHPSLHPSSISLLPLLAGILLGLFLARFWFELDPIRFAFVGEWPGAIGLAVLGAIFLVAQWQLALRHLLPPDASAPVHTPFAILAVYVLWPEVDLRLAAILLLSAAGLAAALGLRSFAPGATPFSSASRGLYRLAPLALAAIVFALYLRTLGAHVGKADTFEFQVIAPALGVAHPTGYPLYVLAGHLFSLLPIGSMAFRVNLTSAVFATAAVVPVYLLIARLGGRRLVALIAALAFAVSSVVWSQAVVAEAYALNALIAGSIIALIVNLLSESAPPSTAASPARASQIVPMLSLLLGLGIAHHLTAVLLLPACGLAILIARPRLRIRAILLALGLFLAGLAFWLYIPLRWPALHGGAPMTPAEFFDWISGARFGGALALGAWSDPGRWSIVARLLLDAFGLAGAALALIGVIGLAMRNSRAALITLVAFAAYTLYGVVYVVPDISVFLIPAYLIMAVWIGVGVAFCLDALTARMGAPARQWTYALALAAFVLMPVGLLAQNFGRVDQRGAGAAAEAWGRYVLGLPIPEGAAILVDSEKIAPLYYLQVTENLRPDLDILVLGAEQEYRRQLDARLAQGQPVYLARFLPNLPYAMRSLGPLVEISSQRADEPAGQARATFGNSIELVGLSTEAGDPARVTFTWRALTDARPNYHVRLRLVDDRDRVWWEDAGTHPVNGYYPTGAWARGEVVDDYHEIAFDPAFPPGAYSLQVGLFPPFRNDGLRLAASGEMWLPVAALTAPAINPPALERAVRYAYGDAIAVSGVASIGVVPRSGDAQARVNWSRITGIENRGIRVSLSLVDGAGQLVGSNVTEPYGGLLDAQDWPAGALQAALDFRAPDRDGVYVLRLGFVDAAGRPLPARCGWLAPLSTDCPLGALQVAGEAIGDAINFDNRVLLTGWSVDRNRLQPGETINVRLDWRGLKSWESDYTAFVHLVGPDGKLHGQVDAWPVQGTLPTSVWAAGQVVNDAYAVTLQADAPRGRYQIEVGWYLLATLRRLPVLDAGGRPVDDRFVAGEFDVP
jgi:hypothetical protein